jgi:hypothetical protein
MVYIALTWHALREKIRDSHVFYWYCRKRREPCSLENFMQWAAVLSLPDSWITSYSLRPLPLHHHDAFFLARTSDFYPYDELTRRDDKIVYYLR